MLAITNRGVGLASPPKIQKDCGGNLKFYPKVDERNTIQKMKFSIKDFFSKCDQIRRKLRIYSHLLKKSLMENFIFYAMVVEYFNVLQFF